MRVVTTTITTTPLYNIAIYCNLLHGYAHSTIYRKLPAALNAQPLTSEYLYIFYVLVYTPHVYRRAKCSTPNQSFHFFSNTNLSLTHTRTHRHRGPTCARYNATGEIIITHKLPSGLVRYVMSGVRLCIIGIWVVVT